MHQTEEPRRDLASLSETQQLALPRLGGTYLVPAPLGWPGRGDHAPMVQMMPVLRAVMGGESMSRRHMCSKKVSAMAACSCCVWMKAVPASLWDFDMALEVLVREIKREASAQGTEFSAWHTSCLHPIQYIYIPNKLILHPSLTLNQGCGHCWTDDNLL